MLHEGRQVNFRTLLIAIGLSLSTAGGSAAGEAANPALETLMRSMASTPGVEADFLETKRLALLDAPLQTRGTLYFIPPGRLARHTTQPGPSRMIIDDEQIVLDDQSGGNRVQLASNPVARAFVDSFLVLFNGNLDELRKRYETRFALDGESWSLLLTPHRDPLKSMIASITMRGDSTTMREMTMHEANGDSTHTVFSRVDPLRVFTGAEVAKFFDTGGQRSP